MPVHIREVINSTAISANALNIAPNLATDTGVPLVKRSNSSENSWPASGSAVVVVAVVVVVVVVTVPDEDVPESVLASAVFRQKFDVLVE